MRGRRLLVTAVVAVFALAGCMATIMVDGHRVSKTPWTRDSTSIRNMASYALHCPKAKLKVTLVDVDPNSVPAYPTAIGAAGCGGQLLYRRGADGQWYANVATKQHSAP